MSSRGAASRDVASVDQTLMRPSSQPVANSPPAATVSATAPTHCGCKCSAKHVPSVRHPQSLARLSLVPLTSRSRSKARLRTPPLRPCRGSLETAPASRRDSASDCTLQGRLVRHKWLAVAARASKRHCWLARWIWLSASSSAYRNTSSSMSGGSSRRHLGSAVGDLWVRHNNFMKTLELCA